MANIEGKYYAAWAAKDNRLLKELHISNNTDKFLKFIKEKGKKFDSMIVPGTVWKFEIFENGDNIVEFVEDSYYAIHNELKTFRNLAINTNFNLINSLKIDYVDGLVAKVVGEEGNTLAYKSYYLAIYTFN